MRRVRPRSVRPKAGWRVTLSNRDRLAVVLAFVTVICLGAAFLFTRDTQFLMPGPLASVHGAIENCSACHTTTGSGQFTWMRGLVASASRTDSDACLNCHRMPQTAFNAHGTSEGMLKESTERLTKIAAGTPTPHWARAQDSAFPTSEMLARGLSCATCHQEHKGVDFKLNKISNEQCHACHVVKFDSFDGNHPEFDSYPFKRRTRIIYDHAGHFEEHFPEVAKKDSTRRIPATCSTCHDSRDDSRVMAVTPFEQTCTACHLNQIIGKERVSGPKGVAFVTLPELDLQTLTEKHASIGEWPKASEAELTPFMRIMLSGDEEGRALVEAVERLNLQDLAAASDEQIEAVTQLVWKIKELLFNLISGKASAVLAELHIGDGEKLSPNLIADLTANIPRDVIVSAQQEWLPNLATEIANRRNGVDPNQGDWKTATTLDDQLPPTEPSDSEASQAVSSSSEGAEAREVGSIPKRDPPICTASIFGKCLSFKGREDAPPADLSQAAGAEDGAGKTDRPNIAEDGEEDEVSADPPPSAELDETGRQVAQDEPSASKDGLTAAPPVQANAAAPNSANPEADARGDRPSGNEPPQEKSADQSDDLLSPTDDERRAMEAAAKAARPDGSAAAQPSSDIAMSDNQVQAAPVSNIKSDVDPETWAEYGGWYRQDYAIFYRPAGHKDKFIYSWLVLTGPYARKGDASPAAAVFDFLTHKDAQGSCTKCHSVDDAQTKGRVVNFFPASPDSKQGRFTAFIHEPHFQAVGIGQRKGVVKNLGCLTCHSLEKTGNYLKSYEHGNPQSFTASFGSVQKQLCLTCHNASTARQDCLTCHEYHVNGVTTPIMSTKIPISGGGM